MTENTLPRVGDYEIIRELGHGGMGKVFQVRNVLTDRVEAMKVLLPDLSGRGEFVARFMREIKTLAGLDHPNIGALRTAFTAGDQFAMIMEYVEGMTLADRLGRGPFSVPEALDYTDQVLSALSYAHAKHIIHRDIKPGNMMLTPQGVVKLMDFGLARSADEVGLTATGTTLGSLDYASPEQVQSQPTDERSDLYSVGVSLYQMVTGKRMFSATSSFSIMMAQVKEQPRPPIELVPSLPQVLNDIIMKSVAKDPAQRYQSADAFRNALSVVLAGSAPSISAPFDVPTASAPTQFSDPGVTVPRPIQPERQTGRNLVLVLGVVLVAALLAGAAMYKSRLHRESDPATVAPAQNSTSQPGSGSPADNSAPQNQSAAPQAQSAPPVADKPAALQQPAATSRKAPPASPPPDYYGSAPSAADTQAAQQAALEQKRQLEAVETDVDHLDGRAASVESGLDALEQQMHQQGLGLRGDMVAARANMRTDVAKAKQAVDSGDTERARHYLDLADREVEKLEAFLGRR